MLLEQLISPLTIFLPWLELMTGLLLITGKWVKGALLIYSVLLVIFIIALVQALIRGLDISCGCFSVNPSSTSEVWLRVVEDIALLFVSFMLFKHSKPNSEVNEEIENKNIINQKYLQFKQVFLNYNAYAVGDLRSKTRAR